MVRLITFLLLVVLPMTVAARTVTSPSPTTVSAPRPANAANGLWVTPKNKSHVRISRAADGSYQGRIVWLDKPDYPADFKIHALAGKPQVDRHNPNKKLRSRPVEGLVVLTGFRYSPKQHAWVKGKCYDPEGGKTYTCRMWLVAGGKKLKVRGYVWIFHKTQTWRRYRGSSSPKAAGKP